MATKGTGKKRGIIKYKSYMWVDKDPIIDVFRTARSDAKMTFTQVEEESGVKAGTMLSWETGNTRRPFFTTISAALRACGVKYIEYGTSGKPKGYR